MKYGEMSEMLLSRDKALTKETAETILDVWRASPDWYKRFVKENGTPLRAYAGSDSQRTEHLFEETKIMVPPSRTADKFFAIKDDELAIYFIETLDILTFFDIKEPGVYAWPYMEEECLVDLPTEALQWVVRDGFFIFDFAKDTDGTKFEFLLQSLDKGERDMFVLSSYNITAWVHKFGTLNNPESYRYFLMSNYATQPENSFDAELRKMMIQFFDSISEDYTQFLRVFNIERGKRYN
jgi:hypothetical protein